MAYEEGGDGNYWDGEARQEEGEESSNNQLFAEGTNTEGEVALFEDNQLTSAPTSDTGVGDDEDDENNPDETTEGGEMKKKRKRTKEEKAERKKRKKEKKERKRREKERKAKELNHKKRRRSNNSSSRGEGEAEDDKGEDEPIMDEDDRRQKKKKKQEITENEAAEIVRNMLDKMAAAADEDDEALTSRQPALAKLAMLDAMCVEVAKPKWVQWYIREGVCHVLGRWLAPLPNGGLPNITIRTKILKLVQKMPLYVENLQGTNLGIRLVAMWSAPEELEENRLAIRDIIQSLMRPLLGIRWSQRQNDDMVEEMSIPRAQPARTNGMEPSRRARIPMSSGYSFKVQPKSQFKRTMNETTRDGESTMARLSRMMAYKKTFGNRTATRAQSVSVSKSVI